MRDGHFAVAAVEVQGEALAVVEKEERTGILDLVVFRTDSQLVSDAIAGAHEFGMILTCEFICRLDRLRSGRQIN